MKINRFVSVFMLTILLSLLPPSVGAQPLSWLQPVVQPPGETGLPEGLSGMPGASSGWWGAVQEDIRQSEYHLTWQEHTYLADLAATYQAPNRAQNLRSYFTLQGVRLIPRQFEGETPPWEWGLALTGYGYAGAV